MATPRPKKPICSAPLLTSLWPETQRPSALGHRRFPLGISARLPKWRRPRSSFSRGSLSGSRRIPLSEAMRETRSRTRNTGCGVGSGIRSLPPLRAARSWPPPTWAFCCASRSGTALKPRNALPYSVTDRLPANGEVTLAGYLHRPTPFFHPPFSQGLASAERRFLARRILGGIGELLGRVREAKRSLLGRKIRSRPRSKLSSSSAK